MPTVTTRYVTWTRGAGRRLHTGPAAAADITSPLMTSVQQDGTYQSYASPSMSWPTPPQNSANFAFWSVTGSATGSWVSTDSTVTVPVGATDATAIAWYLPVGGSGPSGPALLIDAFDVTQGWWADDDFVTVVSDPSLTFNANQFGVVPLDKQQDVHAFNTIHSVPFDDWLVIAHNETVNGQDLHGDAGTTAIAFAFYAIPARMAIPQVGVVSESSWVSWGVKVDGGGPSDHGPIAPWNPTLVLGIAAGMALAEAAELIDPELRDDALRIAAKQVEISADKISAQLTAKGD